MDTSTQTVTIQNIALEFEREAGLALIEAGFNLWSAATGRTIGSNDRSNQRLAKRIDHPTWMYLEVEQYANSRSVFVVTGHHVCTPVGVRAYELNGEITLRFGEFGRERRPTTEEYEQAIQTLIDIAYVHLVGNWADKATGSIHLLKALNEALTN